jgi:site-specific DNA-methyltransferase (adenine-specific)
MRDSIIRAFLAVRANSESPDAVIADPELNQRFVTTCRQQGLTEHVELLNRTLLNSRKAGFLKGLKSKPVVIRSQEHYRFASEIAVRFLEHRDRVTLDAILCHPERAAEFDTIAAQIAPGFSVFEYRWAALGLRKKRKLMPELVSKVLEDVVVKRYRVSELDIESIADQQGVYLLHDSTCTLYVGEAASLYRRLKKHLDHSDNKGLARWLWEHGAGDLHLELHILPATTATISRKALEAELIKSRRPTFNVSGIAQ